MKKLFHSFSDKPCLQWFDWILYFGVIFVPYF